MMLNTLNGTIFPLMFTFFTAPEEVDGELGVELKILNGAIFPLMFTFFTAPEEVDEELGVELVDEQGSCHLFLTSSSTETFQGQI